MDFPYGETEIAYLRARDLKLGAAMDRIGPIHRENRRSHRRCSRVRHCIPSAGCTVHSRDR